MAKQYDESYKNNIEDHDDSQFSDYFKMRDRLLINQTLSDHSRTHNDTSRILDHTQATQYEQLIASRTPSEPQYQVSSMVFQQNEKIEQQKCWPTSKLFFKHACRDLKRHKCHFSLAFCSVFTVVLSSLIVASIVGKGPVIFLKMAESHQGEIDGYLTPYGQTNISPFTSEQYKFLNYTSIQEIKNVKKKEYNLSPRKVFCGAALDIYPTALQKAWNSAVPQPYKRFLQNYELYGRNENDTVSLPSREDTYNHSGIAYSETCIQLTNTTKERDIGVGTNYTFDTLKYGECNINSAFVQSVGVKEGDIVILDIYTQAIYDNLITKFNIYALEKGLPTMNNTEGPILTKIPCSVSNIMQSTYGKFPDDGSDQIIMLEYGYFLSLLGDYLPDELYKNLDFAMFIQNEDLVTLDEYADQIIMTLPSPRYSWYSNDDFDTIQKKVTNYLNNLLDDVGFYPISVQLFILEEMELYSIAILFFHLVFDIVELIFVIISILLIYSLLLIRVETKTLEIGIMRMVGLSKSGLVLMIFIQSILFVIPAIFFGILLCFPVLALAYTQVFDVHLKDGFPPVPTGWAVAEALSIGLIIPLLSSIIPVYRVLGQNLNDALNYERSRTKSIYIEILKANKSNIIPIIIFGLLAIVYGIAIFYLLPLSMLSMDLGLILQVFFFILFGMLLGLCLLAVNGSRLIQIALTYILLCFEKKSMKKMVLNNLKAHKLRNRLTSIIYSLALGFIIFLIVSYKLQITQNKMNQLRRKGPFPGLNANQAGSITPQLLDPVIKNHMNNIDSFAWVSFDLQRFPNSNVQNVYDSDLPRLNTYQMGVYGITPSLFQTTGDQFIDSYFTNSKTGLNLAEQLYTAKGAQGAGISTLVVQRTKADPKKSNQNPYTLMFVQGYQRNFYYKIRPIFALSQAPMFTMTDRDGQSNKQSQLISLPMIAQYGNLTIEQIPYERLVFNMKDGTIRQDQVNLINDLQAKVGSNPDSGYVAYRMNNQNALEKVDGTIQILFDVIIAITMFLCFFSLSSSMSANLYEQTKEIGVLRSIGFTKNRIIILYIYEAFILVISSSMQGILIGIVVGWTMTVQQQMFSDIPITFYFPWVQFLIVFGVSVLCAVLSTFGPTKRIINNEISSIIRMA